jgi:hypothetical protein
MKYDLKVCDDGKLVQLLRSWTLSIVSSLSKMSSCLHLKTQRFGDWILSSSSGKTDSGPIDRTSPYLETPVSLSRWDIYIQTQFISES